MVLRPSCASIVHGNRARMAGKSPRVGETQTRTLSTRAGSKKAPARRRNACGGGGADSMG